MKQFNQAEKQAFSQQHPKQKATVFQVISCGVVVFEGDVRLCWGFIRANNLKCKPKAKR
jgi:hypothetical protein